MKICGSSVNALGSRHKTCYSVSAESARINMDQQETTEELVLLSPVTDTVFPKADSTNALGIP